MAHQQVNNTKLAATASELIEQAKTLGTSVGFGSKTPEELAEAEGLLSDALAISRTAGVPGVEASCRYQFGNLYTSLQQYDKAFEFYTEAERILQSTGADPKMLSMVLTMHGRLFYSQGDYPEALRLYIGAIDVCERTGVDDYLSIACLDLGNAYREIGMYDDSLQTCRRALDVARASADRGVEVLALGNAAQALMMLGRLDDAVASAQDAVNLAQGTKSLYVYSANVCLGRALVSAGRPSDAIPLYRQADELAHADLDQPARSAAKLLLGEALVEDGELAEAKTALYDAIERATPIDMKRDLSRAHYALSKIFKSERDYAAALTHFEAYHDLHSQIFSEESDRRIGTILNRWETEKAQQEAEIHRLKNVELLQANQALASANALLQEQAEELQAQAEELEAQAEELVRLATVDSLTNLYNRRYMHEWFSRQFLHAQRHDEDLAVVMLDIDHFKKINDDFGHQIGDSVLQIVARVINSVCRRTDLAARYGGEEFVVALPLTDELGAWSLCERIRQTVETYTWTDIHPDLAVTVSIGLTADRDVDTYDSMLSAADQQLYLAKNSGRNQVCPHVDAVEHQRAA